MKIIKENNLETICYNNDIEQYAEAQIKNIMNQDCIKKYNPIVRLMPDVHPGKIGPIGLTIKIKIEAPIMPGLLGPDIGCGVSVFKITSKRNIDFQKLDKVINQYIPSGNKIHNESGYNYSYNIFKGISHDNDYMNKFDWDRIQRSCSTLGGGNHFIELDKSDDNIYLIIHSGSRQFGKQVYDYFMREGHNKLKTTNIPYEMTYLEDTDCSSINSLKYQYIEACKNCISFASLNRQIIAEIICYRMKWDFEIIMDKPHNFISFDISKENNVDSPEYIYLYKGAQSAKKDEPVIIPINMKEGCILGIGKGNLEWNFAAPHGSGRVYKRSEVANYYTVNQFKKDMKGIYSTSIRKDTLDEAPIAYRSMDQIKSLIEPDVEITDILHPIYNFKAGNEK